MLMRRWFPTTTCMKMKNKRVYQIGLLTLILLNVVLIYLLVNGPKRPSTSEPRRGSIIEKISAHLELTDDQVSDYRLMAAAHRKQMTSFEKDHRTLIKAYFETLNEHSSTSVDSIKYEILKNESDKLEYTYEHFEELKSILSDQQRARFPLIIKDIVVVLTNQRGGRRPPPRD